MQEGRLREEKSILSKVWGGVLGHSAGTNYIEQAHRVIGNSAAASISWTLNVLK